MKPSGRKLEVISTQKKEKERATLAIRAELPRCCDVETPLGRACSVTSTGEFLSVFTPTVCQCGSLILIYFDAQQTPPSKLSNCLPSKPTSVLMTLVIRQCPAFPELVRFYSQLYQTTQLL
uniref:Uncharacterized protein n=1 Tax=Molossus molossus TaxID=27622 RepID=A0A7J8F8W1_MOLMO|nr:hypothetical protein HJG59_008507 [Molossus molossus]